MKRPVRIGTTVTLMLLLISTAGAEQRKQVFVGARPVGLGGAFTAVADDAHAIYWNPAGLPLLQRTELTGTYGDLFGLGMQNSYFAGTYSVTDNLAVGMDWFRDGFDDNVLMFGKNKINFSGAYRYRTYSLGLNLKYVDVGMELDNVSLGKASGFGLDIGLLASLSPTLKVGAVAHDVAGTSVTYENDVAECILPRSLRAGVSYKPLENWTTALDLGDRLHVGTEYWVTDQLGVRAGLQKDLDTRQGFSESLLYAAGIGLKYSVFQIDYAYEHHPVLPATHRFGLTVVLQPPIVSIKHVRLEASPLFRSLYRHYEQTRFLEVELKNASQGEVEATVSVEVPTMTDRPYETTLTLPPQSSEVYSIAQISFSDSLLLTSAAGYDNLVQPKITVAYMSGKKSHEESKALESVSVYGKGRISWDDPQSVGAFILFTDEGVDRFAGEVAGEYQDLLKERFHRSNIGMAMALYDALSAYGIRYQRDPVMPYNPMDKTILDNVKYPGELLERKLGDCDDCTVLYSALLENRNVDTVLLDVSAPGEGHIYLMFDSGIDPNGVSDHFLDTSEYVSWRDRIWIPIEVTHLGVSSFMDAWRIGTAGYHRWKEDGFVQEIEVREALQAYRPGTVKPYHAEVPGKEEMDRALYADLDLFEDRTERIATGGESPQSGEGFYDAGAYYLRIRRLDRALEMMARSVELDSSFADAYNALGVIHTMRREYEQALSFYERALEINPLDAGVRKNIALTYALQGKREEAVEEYRTLIEQNPEYEGTLDDYLHRERVPGRSIEPGK